LSRFISQPPTIVRRMGGRYEEKKKVHGRPQGSTRGGSGSACTGKNGNGTEKRKNLKAREEVPGKKLVEKQGRNRRSVRNEIFRWDGKGKAYGRQHKEEKQEREEIKKSWGFNGQQGKTVEER